MTTSASTTATPTAPPAARGGLAGIVHAAARAAQRRPKTIIALWLAFVIACTVAGSLVGTRALTSTQSGVGESARADTLIHRAGLADPATENVLVSSADAALTARVATALGARLAALPQVATVRGPAQSAELVADAGRAALVQAILRGDPDDATDHVGPVEAAVAATAREHAGVRLQEAGGGSENEAINELVGDGLSRAERISLPITLVILVLAFGALVAASVPLLLGVTSVAAALGALGLVSQVAPSGDSTSPLVALIGLAVGVDYSLFYVRREREERRAGRPEAPRRRSRWSAAGRSEPARPLTREESALEAAAASVGRAILISGGIVVVALGGLLITGQADFISMGLGTILVVLIAVLGSLTVLPAVLALLGDRVERGRLPGYRRRLVRRARRNQVAGGRRSGLWAGLSRAVTARPKASLVTAVCLLGALAVPMFGMRTAGLAVDDLPHDLPVVQAMRAIDASFPGAPQDAQLVVAGAGLGEPAAREQLAALGRRGLAVTGGGGEVGVAVSTTGQLARIDIPMPERGLAAAKATVRALRAEVAPTADRVRGSSGTALVTGDAASGLDYSARMATATPEVIAFVLALGFLLLLVTFRAPWLAAAMMGLNLLSIGAAYGILVAVFQHRWAEDLLGFHSSGHVINWLPLMMFVILFGLSMDYTVLVLERIREARQAGWSPARAAAEGVAATGSTVTSAATVMVAVFGIFATLDLINFKELGIGLGAAVLLDATVVRGLALPAVVALLGERGWPVRSARSAPVAHPVRWDDALVAEGPLRAGPPAGGTS